MAEEANTSRGLSGLQEEIDVEFPDSVIARIPVTRMGENLYRLEGLSPLTECVGYRDIVDAEPTQEGIHRIRRVVERSGWRRFQYALLESRIRSAEGQMLLNRLEELGGRWEVWLSGWLMIYLPPGVDLDPTEWVRAFGGSTAFTIEG